jgi:hypothetical protein
VAGQAEEAVAGQAEEAVAGQAEEAVAGQAEEAVAGQVGAGQVGAGQAEEAVHHRFLRLAATGATTRPDRPSKRAARHRKAYTGRELGLDSTREREKSRSPSAPCLLQLKNRSPRPPYQVRASTFAQQFALFT